MDLHSWESAEPVASASASASSAHSWEVGGEERDDWLDVDFADDPENCSTEHAEEMLYDMLVDLKFAGILSATKACIIAFLGGEGLLVLQMVSFGK